MKCPYQDCVLEMGHNEPHRSPIRIENWSICAAPGMTAYDAPETVRRCLHGEAYGDPRHPDGTSVTTSPIVGIKGGLVLTRNSQYELGVVNPDYEAAYPNAKERLLGSGQ